MRYVMLSSTSLLCSIFSSRLNTIREAITRLEDDIRYEQEAAERQAIIENQQEQIKNQQMQIKEAKKAKGWQMANFFLKK